MLLRPLIYIVCFVTLDVLGIVDLAIFFVVFMVGYVTNNIVEGPVRVFFLTGNVVLCFLNLDISAFGGVEIWIVF